MNFPGIAFVNSMLGCYRLLSCYLTKFSGLTQMVACGPETLMSDNKSAEKISGEASEKFFTAPLVLVFITVLIDLIGFGIVIPILPLYAQSELFQASPLWIGLLTSIFSWMQFIFSPILGQLSDKYGRRPILFFSLVGSAAGYLVVGAGTTF